MNIHSYTQKKIREIIMCTAINVKTNNGDIFLGRTMDFSYALDPQLYMVNKGYQWNTLANTHSIKTRYSFMGIGQDISPIAFADGINEMGFSVAVLYFPGYANYDLAKTEDNKKPAIANIELVKFLLSTCSSVEEAKKLVCKIRIIGVEDPVTNSVAPLHWIMADKSGDCAVVEKMVDGLHIMDNPIGVLSNSPEFTWQMTNLRNYMNVTSTQKKEAIWGDITLTPFGQGAGGFGIPGDYTSPSRFVRAAFQKHNTNFLKTCDEAVVACFHIMDSVSIPKGVVMTKRGTSDYTQYTAFMNLRTNEYYFKSYNNSSIVSVKLLPFSENKNIISLGKITTPISFMNGL